MYAPGSSGSMENVRAGGSAWTDACHAGSPLQACSEHWSVGKSMRPLGTSGSTASKYIVSSVPAAHRPQPTNRAPLKKMSNSVAGIEEQLCDEALSIATGISISEGLLVGS